MPSMRSDSGCVVSKMPIPISVVTTGNTEFVGEGGDRPAASP